MSANPANVNQPTPGATPARKTREDEIRELDALLGDTVPPLIAEGREAFRRDLPALLGRHRGKWAAYSGSQRLSVGRSKTQLYQECLNRGLRRGEFIVLTVKPECDEEIDLPLDV
jgi:hypothetical protein